MKQRLAAIPIVSAVLIVLTVLGAAGLVAAIASTGGRQVTDVRVFVPGATRDGQASPTAPPPTVTAAEPSPSPSGPTPTATPTPQALQQAQLTVTDGTGADRIITVQVAHTPAQRTVGLMWVTGMPEDEGMIFLYGSDHSGGFWMRNTFIPLDIAYIAADGTIQEIHSGIPLNEQTLSPSSPYRHTLEMNAGWFAANGFGPGSRVILPDGLPEPQ
jgi:hypothetical protein